MKQNENQGKIEEKTYCVVAVIIKDGDKCLCMQRGRSHYAYISKYWKFPGREVEEGESDYEALVRETKEEMDWDIFVGKKVGTVESHYPDFNMHLTAYPCKDGDEEFKMLEHLDYRWFTIDELNDLKWAKADGKLIEILKTKTI